MGAGGSMDFERYIDYFGFKSIENGKRYLPTMGVEYNKWEKVAVSKVCQHCGVSYDSKANSSKYCSTKCARKARAVVQKCVCIVCGANFTSESGRATYCSDECKISSRVKKPLDLRSCAYCGKEFTNIHKEVKYCCHACSVKARTGADEIVACEHCGKGFTRKVGSKQKYCCRECSRLDMSNVYRESDIVSKIKSTKKERHGDENYNNAEKAQATIRAGGDALRKKRAIRYRNNCLSVHGVTNPSKLPEIKAIIGANTKALASKTLPLREATMLERYGVVNALQLSKRYKNSKINNLWAERLPKGFITEKRIDRSIFDFCYEDAKLLIEINPTITHSIDINYQELITGRPCGENRITDDYHYTRWLLAKSNGYELISIFDWFDVDSIVSLITAKVGGNIRKVGARQCSVVKIKTVDANKFFAENHNLGAVAGKSREDYALVKDGETLSVMCCTLTRGGVAELKHFATKRGCTVQGGLSRLWKSYISDHPNISEVITYTDNNIGNGLAYTALGFTYDSTTKGDTVFFHMRWGKRLRQTTLIRQGADRVLKGVVEQNGEEYFTVGLDREDYLRRGGAEFYKKEHEANKDNQDYWVGNVDIALHYGYVRVVDCGYSKWVWRM